MTFCHLLSWENGAVCKAVTFLIILWHLSTGVAHLAWVATASAVAVFLFYKALLMAMTCLRARVLLLPRVAVAKGHVTVVTPSVCQSQGSRTVRSSSARHWIILSVTNSREFLPLSWLGTQGYESSFRWDQSHWALPLCSYLIYLLIFSLQPGDLQPFSTHSSPGFISCSIFLTLLSEITGRTCRLVLNIETL